MVNRSRSRGKFAQILLAFAALSFTVSAARTAQAPSTSSEIPKTPPGEQFSAWLSAFNGGDKAELEKFRGHFDKPQDHKVEGMLGFRQQTGGFDLRKIEDSTGTQLTALVQERDSDQFARLKIEVEAAAPNKITHLDVRAIERPAEFTLPRLSQSDLVTALRAKLEKDSAAGKFSGVAGTSQITRSQDGCTSPVVQRIGEPR